MAAWQVILALHACAKHLRSVRARRGKLAGEKGLFAPAGMRVILRNKGVRDDHLLERYKAKLSFDATLYIDMLCNTICDP
eukprot:1155476-Pelagomonas_calceolata.AAC.1